MDCASFTPLRITAYLRTPVVSDEFLPLDGILLYQQVRAELGVQQATLPGASPLAQEKGGALRGDKLPLKIVHSKEWYYRCSWAQWSVPCVDERGHWVKRFRSGKSDLIDFGGKRGKVEVKAGPYKAYRMPVFGRSALWVAWYCVGDAESLTHLLSTVTHIGKKGSQGWGRVIRWEITPVPEDWSIWKEGRLLRGIPADHLPKGYPHQRIAYGIRPSYWDSRNQMELCVCK